MVMYFIVIILAVKTELSTAWRPFIFRVDSVECHHAEPFIDFCNCSTVRVKRAQEGINMNIRFANDIFMPQLDLAITLERLHESDFVLANLTNIDGCEFLENKGKFNILQIIRKQFEKHSNLPKKCPVQKGTVINVDQLTLEPDSFPPYVPAAKFFVSVLLKVNKEIPFRLSITGRAESKKTLKAILQRRKQFASTII